MPAKLNVIDNRWNWLKIVAFTVQNAGDKIWSDDLIWVVLVDDHISDCRSKK